MALKALSITGTVLGALALGIGAVAFNGRAAAQPEGMDVGQLLVDGLKSTPGCLRVDVADTPNRRACIFAWFDSKAAVERWYYSPTHKQAMRMFTPGFEAEGHRPMTDIPDDIGPIMVVASIVQAPANQVQGVDLPISAIAIELYKPLPGGAYIGSSFGPPEVYPSLEAIEIGAAHNE